MRTRRSVSGGIISISSLLLIGGCSQFALFSPGAKPQSSQASASYPAKLPLFPAATTLPAAESDAPSADSLAAKVQSFRHDVEPQLKTQRATMQQDSAAMSAAAAATISTTRPALWQTADFSSLPSMVRFSNYQQEETPLQVHAAPAASADRGLSTPDANSPIIVPEGQERDTGAAAIGAITASATQSPGRAMISAGDRQIEERVRDYPHDLESQLDHQLLLFAQGQSVPEMGSLSGLSAEDREIVSTLLDGLTNFRSVVRSGSNLLLGSKIKPLTDMSDRLRIQSELSIPTLSLCREVKSYGVYTPVNSNRFTAGKDNNLIVYAEVENFDSQATADNQFQTKLTEEVVLYTESGMAAWPAKSTPQAVVDVCRERRHDFFIARMVALPKNLTIGRYLMKVTITDETANHVAEATAPVEIVAE